MDELRALREARYEQMVARSAANRAGAPRRTDRPVARPAESPAAESPAAESPAAESPAAESPAADLEVRLCGHRAISGRTCTREHGHTAKSHRYS